nr:transposase [Amycolatopsis aidingensis]
MLLRQTLRLSGAQRALSGALAPWRGRRAAHDPGKIVCDVAIAVALGGDCLADLAVVRAQAEVFGLVASDPTVSRLFSTLAADSAIAVPAIRSARAQARAAVWARRRPLAGGPGTQDGGQVIVDIDATLVTAHSDKEQAAPTHKRGFGFAPMCAFVDHGEHGTGETLVAQLRPGNASPWNKQDHIEAVDLALAQLPERERAHVLIRADSGRLLQSAAAASRRPGGGILDRVPRARNRQDRTGDHPGAGLARRPRQRRPTARGCAGRRTHCLDAHTDPASRPGPQDWPPGMRVIARRQRPHPGAQLRLTGNRPPHGPG